MRNLTIYSIIIVILFSFSFILVNVSANYYAADIFFTIPDTVFRTNEQISLVGNLTQANYSDNGSISTSSRPVSSATINLTLWNKNNVTQQSNYTLTTDSNGLFYTRSNYYASGLQINASNISSDYYIRAQYIDPNNTIWQSTVEVSVVNTTIDILRVSAGKSNYNPSELVIVEVEAIRMVGDRVLYVNNVSINGSLMNASQSQISNFSCNTGSNGKCIVNFSAPSTYGNYLLELGNFRAYSSFFVVPFTFSIYMKDDLGKSLKNVYAIGEQGRLEVSIINASSSDSYNFSGYIADSAGNVVKSINITSLTSNNSFTNTFLFTVDALTFGYGAYRASVTVVKDGDGNITSSASFEVKDWVLSLNKRATFSGFEYEFSTFPSKPLFFEILPTYRLNGTVLTEINSTFFTAQIKDSLNNILNSANVTWNVTCGKAGCYQFNITAPNTTGQYNVYISLSTQGSTQTRSQVVNVISGVLSTQSTDKDGSLKELFGVNEFLFLSLSSYNQSTAQINLSDAEVFTITYMNGTELNYTQVNNFTVVNATNNISEWAWNSTSQRIKLDVPRAGGVYDVLIFGNNRSFATIGKFIVNPYDACVVPKDTVGQVTSGFYYVWQFKTTDTIYFELKLTQANNPLGRATALNDSSGNSSSYGKGNACSIDTTTKQAVTNATITLAEVSNMQSGAIQSVNTTDTNCQASDSSGTYTCTVKPFSKWDSGTSIVKFNVQGQDGTTSVVYSRFEARAFYLYGYSSTWQNSPLSNITLNVQMYEAGSNWWGSSSGLSGTVTLKKIEYQGSDGEWLASSVESGYNVSGVNSTSITGSSGTMSIPVSFAQDGKWKTGYYRAIIQGTTSTGDTDYGYAWFGVKLWDVYGQPVECGSSGCNYKNFFNSKENITLYIKISTAGDYSYSYSGGQGLGGGNVTVGVKKLLYCKNWPCKELNASQYNASLLTLNESSPWYWNANNVNQSKYLLQINRTGGSWESGYYNVVLSVNGTDTGYGWFNSLAFYVETQPTDNNGSTYVYSVRGNKPIYFNTTVAKANKYGFYSGSTYIRYNVSDYVNTTIDSITLRRWNESSGKAVEYTYLTDINISVVNRTGLNLTGNSLVNITYLNGSWPSGWYWGEMTLKNAVNETSSGYLWFNVMPFRVQLSQSTYNLDVDQCINTTLNVYDPSWYSNTILAGNYSIISVYEEIWTGSSSSRTSYTNFTNSSFNATANITFCPNSGGEWGGGSWGGYHYMNIIVKDNVANDTGNGWLYFRSVPFQIIWGSVSGGNAKLTNANVVVPANVTRYATGQSTTGNLTQIYQWRYDNGRSTKESYNFSVGSCYSNVSGQCVVNGTQNVTIYAPSSGWRVGYNYLYAIWTKQNSAATKVEDWSGIYIEGREAYNGYFDNVDTSGNWKYYFKNNENITIGLTVRDSSYNSVNVTISSVDYAYSGDNCWSEWCRTYTSATWSKASQNSNNRTIITIQVPSSNWSKGYYAIRAGISGGSGTATITGGSVKVKDFSIPNITAISSPVNNATYNTTNISFSATTARNAQCYIFVINYDNFNSWYCSGWNSSNSTSPNITQQKRDACNSTKYSYNGSRYYTTYVSSNYYSSYNGSSSTWQYGAGTGLTTGGTTHTYTINTTGWFAQHYGMQIWCNDDDWNYVSEVVAFKVNVTS